MSALFNFSSVSIYLLNSSSFHMCIHPSRKGYFKFSIHLVGLTRSWAYTTNMKKFLKQTFKNPADKSKHKWGLPLFIHAYKPPLIFLDPPFFTYSICVLHLFSFCLLRAAPYTASLSPSQHHGQRSELFITQSTMSRQHNTTHIDLQTQRGDESKQTA